MAEESMWEKFKASMVEDKPKTKTPIRGLDPEKAKAFSAVFNGGDSSSDDAIGRRLKKITENY
jgi:hypothetical protein